MGNDSDDFKAAGRFGARVLSHLLGRSIESLAKDIALYRRTWAESGHAGEGYVTVVAPTLVGDNEAVIKQAAREALKARLREDVSLLREAAWDFPDFAKASEEQGATLDEFLSTRSGEQLEALLHFSAERYVATSGLFGGQFRCLALVERLKQIGVDEIGCLIDFGWPASATLEHLPALNNLRLASNPRKIAGTDTSGDDTAASTARSSSTLPMPAAKPPLGPGRTETQKKMAVLWEKLLDVPEVDLSDNFFDLGGHSLLAARAVSEIDRTFGARLPLKTLMVSSLSQVASEIDRLAADRLAHAQTRGTIRSRMRRPRAKIPTSGASRVGSRTRGTATDFKTGEPVLNELAKARADLTPETPFARSQVKAPLSESAMPSLMQTRVRPLFFNGEPQRLFGVYYEPSGDRCAGSPVLICPPIGHEYVRSYNAIRKLCVRLSESGFAVLKFDYCGLGDSYGDGSEVHVGEWRDNIRAAASELCRSRGKRRSRLSACVWAPRWPRGSGLRGRLLGAWCCGTRSSMEPLTWPSCDNSIERAWSTRFVSANRSRIARPRASCSASDGRHDCRSRSSR